MNNLFTNLEKYSGNEKRTPHEEYFTQIISYLLNHDKNIGKNFIKFISGIDIDESDESFLITPEYFVKDIGEFDILIEKPQDLLIVIESKMGAKAIKKRANNEDIEGLSKEEVEEERESIFKYINWIKKQNHKHKFLILITYPYEKYIPVEKTLKDYLNGTLSFKHIPWNEIHYFLKSLNMDEYKESIKSFLVNEIIKYMEDENMNSWKSIDNQSNDQLFKMWKVYNQFNKTLDDVTSVFLKKLEDCKQKNKDDSIVGDTVPSIYRELKINKKIELTFGFNAEDNENGSKFSFFIEIDEPKKGFFDKSRLELDDNIKIESEDGENYIETEHELTEEFFNKSRIKQKKELEEFINDTLDELIKIKII